MLTDSARFFLSVFFCRGEIKTGKFVEIKTIPVLISTNFPVLKSTRQMLNLEWKIEIDFDIIAAFLGGHRSWVWIERRLRNILDAEGSRFW